MAVALMAITACSGKGSQTEGDIPNGMVRTRGDSLALAARFTGDFQYFLAVTDSLADDPRGRTITVAYLAIIDEPVAVTGQDDAAKSEWWPLSDFAGCDSCLYPDKQRG